MTNFLVIYLILAISACDPEKPDDEKQFQVNDSDLAEETETPLIKDEMATGTVREPEPNYEVLPAKEQVANLAFTSCLDLKNKISNASNGIYKLYQLDQNNKPIFFDGYCDMESENGGWTMILNYVHLGGTNPPLQAMTNAFPKFNANNLGDDEQNTVYFGHLTPAFLAGWSFTELRFFCRSSGHNRIIHFSTDSATCLDYLKTGAGNCDDVANNFTALTGHTATIPGNQGLGTNNAGDDAILDRPFKDANNAQNWDIRHGGNDDDWECDDDVDNSSNNTIHRAWFR